MYYVVAAAPKNDQPLKEQEIANFIRQGTPLMQENGRDGRPSSTIHTFDINRKEFKIGSLDLLMQLNETSGRLDSQLEVLCKKLEKIELDTRGDDEQGNLMYRVNYQNPGTPWGEYIRDFKWIDLKYPKKRSLNELTITIQKNMHQKDEQIRKLMDEFNNVKQRISNMTKKDTGNLTVRDFTDDIYQNKVPAELFVETHNSEIFANLFLIVNDDKIAQVNESLPTMMEKYYEATDAIEMRRVRDLAKQKFNDIMNNHKKFLEAKAKLNAEAKATQEAAAAQNKPAVIEEEKGNEQLAKMEESEDQFTQLLENKKNVRIGELDAKDMGNMLEDDYRLFLETEHYLTAEGRAKIAENNKIRMPMAMAPKLRTIGINDREHNQVYHTIVHKPQIDDVIKACRKAGITAKTFSYDQVAWEEEKVELTKLTETFGNKKRQINQVSTDLFQDVMVALMHLKVIRAYIEGVLRFGIEKTFMLGLVCPKKGTERTILTQMNTCLADEHLREYYGEKMDAQENDDYWPFVCVPLTCPLHVFD